MKLYKSFLGVNGQEINVDGEEVNKIVTYLMASSKHCDKDEVMNWFIKGVSRAKFYHNLLKIYYLLNFDLISQDIDF